MRFLPGRARGGQGGASAAGGSSSRGLLDVRLAVHGVADRPWVLQLDVQMAGMGCAPHRGGCLSW